MTILATDKLSLLSDAENISPDMRESLIATFEPLYNQADLLITEATGIVVKDATCVTEMKQSRATRLKLREVRVAAENARKIAKENSLRVGKAIDSIAGKIKAWCEPVEARLLEQEQFAERAEARRKEELKESRTTILAPYVGTDAMFYDLAAMPEETFQQLYQNSKLAHEAKLEAAAKAEAERLVALAAKREEEIKLRAENERLRKEAEAKELALQAEREVAENLLQAAKAKAKSERDAAAAKAAAERKVLEDKARAEAQAREKLEREIAEKHALEQKRIADAAAAKKAAERAPDKDKLQTIITQLNAIVFPAVKTPEAAAVVEKARAFIEQLKSKISENIKSM